MLTINPVTPSLSLTVICGFLVFLFITLLHVSSKENARLKIKRRGIPIAKFYAEMVHIIDNATEMKHLECITALLIDFEVEYSGREPQDYIDEYRNDIIAMRKEKRADLIDAQRQKRSIAFS